MSHEVLSVREIERRDIDAITAYWLESDAGYLEGMGVDLAKLPAQEEWAMRLAEQLDQSYEEKQSYCIIWQVNNKAVGHSNVNRIKFGDEAYMHLHLWNTDGRKKGLGSRFVAMTLPFYFDNLKLKKLYCEPYALNIAPNKTLRKVGFEFVKQYVTTPGWINFEQQVNLWALSYEKYKEIKSEGQLL